MGKIHELSEILSNQIAAGEVIERPASVVKELAENAIDANSTQIDIVIEQAGLQLIQVIDNGDGIEPEDVPTAFKRHATSKIATRQDLFKIQSLGFRGEALASIASVSDLTIETATADSLGTFAHFKGGVLEEQKTNPIRPGTAITVRDLFFNTPARLKYVKTFQTELANVIDIVNRLAMSHPQIAFTLTNDDHLLLKTAGNNDLQQTIAGIYGVTMAKQLLPVSAEDLDFKLTGYVSLPKLTRASRNYISVLINGRYIKNYQLNKAIIKGYGSKLMVGRYPVVVLNIQMDPLLIDVNVHPTKQEVRLSKEPALMALIEKAIRERLSTENLIPGAVQNLKQTKPVDVDQLQMDLNQITSQRRNATGTVRPIQPQTVPEKPVKTEMQAAAQIAETETPLKREPTANPNLNSLPIFEQPQQLARWDDKYEAEAIGNPFGEQPEDDAAPIERFPALRYIGQLHNTFLLAEGEDGFYILDQHAAQERIKYEYYREKIGEVSNDAQNLLVPLVLEYPNSDAIKIQAQKELLAAVGVQLESFGQNSFVIHSHPTWIAQGQEEATIREMIDTVLENGKLDIAHFREKTAIMISCKQSIKAHHHLDDAQAKALLVDLAQTENPFNCPHGRPVLIHYTQKDLEKMFKRIQDPHHSWEGE
ncbi:DNA mismatch repair endonuclease MutL [Latilactobacillus curvatus]|uniref:DNA mismatch repair endonuclease MutL n=1 Tax=Latilactobacillus curvatus TaxID=28038 RepID=UPI0020C7B503|nr:DNA mismatch repair endonuclease MutL [Latilactobacillus curvatus]MCP8847708.1 DNA mismatch repair endonuclease MutL [Latilactobacillus curvatus]MCP8864378.1 DNA mismatch repair endonuclease MutL [Latilactobacillus curvatus]MCP8873253.1 DNA mismatch repair endonuclease MutL [Latilactobacillus curvatus]MCP8875045.1 DNA mismatch repair endonuclease MutL [Latilactobacillus curvatus]MCP8878629.1 DNA mismatch repair endonuclease MutL [Latilactobacillus curvatus]